MQTTDPADTVDDEVAICKRYEAQLASMGRLDRIYYLKQKPTIADRAAYAARQDEREKIRARLFAELRPIRAKKPPARIPLSIRVDDKAMGTATTSTPVCRMLHDLRNDVAAVLCRCETLLEEVSRGRSAANDAASLLELAKKMTRRLHEPCACEAAQFPSKSLANF